MNINQPPPGAEQASGFVGGDPQDQIKYEEFRNLSSWLLTFSPFELSVYAVLIAIYLSQFFTIEERAVVGSFFSSISGNLFLIASQQDLINSAIEEEAEIKRQQEAIRRKEEEEIQETEELIRKEIERRENEKTKEDINQLKEQVRQLQEIIDNQLRT